MVFRSTRPLYNSRVAGLEPALPTWALCRLATRGSPGLSEDTDSLGLWG